MSVLGEVTDWATNARLTQSRRHVTDKYPMPYTHILPIYSLVSIGTLEKMLKTFMTCLYKFQDICDMIVLI